VVENVTDLHLIHWKSIGIQQMTEEMSQETLEATTTTTITQLTTIHDEPINVRVVDGIVLIVTNVGGDQKVKMFLQVVKEDVRIITTITTMTMTMTMATITTIETAATTTIETTETTETAATTIIPTAATTIEIHILTTDPANNTFQDHKTTNPDIVNVIEDITIVKEEEEVEEENRNVKLRKN
tara:strand:- start:402 stop:953 length:552 start_codon:yes stop_codon:yes gene_type:complete